MGFDAGDCNLYRYVNNQFINAADPSGMQFGESRANIIDRKALQSAQEAKKAFGEADALKILKKEIKRWQDNKWSLAANFLQWFIDKKGPTAYKYTDGDMCEVIVESRPVVRRAIQTAINAADFGDIDPTGLTATYTGSVRWWPTFRESPEITGMAFGGKLLGKVKADIQATNNDLFYAYGGARLQVKSTVTDTVKNKVKGRVVGNVDVSATVTIDDNYTFQPEEFPRMEFEAYRAANWLETKMKNSPYKPFSTNVTFGDSYGGFLYVRHVKGG